MASRCSSCGAEALAIAGEPCGACGEGPEGRELIRYCSVSILDKCDACGQPLPVEGPLREIFCSSCQRTNKVSPSYWRLLKDVLEDSVKARGKAAGFSMNFRTDVNHRLAAPSCDACEQPIPVAAIADGSDGEHACPACGEAFDTYPAPDWLLEVMPAAQQIFFAARPGGGDQDLPDDVKPVLFPCPGCAGSLKITARHERIVTCEYCGSDCYLPDALWLRLHPPRVRTTWYVRFRDVEKAKRIAAQKAKRERQRAAELERFRAVMAEVDARRGADENPRELSTFFAVTSAAERDKARQAVERAMASGWALEPTARCVLTLRGFLRDSSREEKLLHKLEVLIAERDGAAALALLDSIKVSGD